MGNLEVLQKRVEEEFAEFEKSFADKPGSEVFKEHYKISFFETLCEAFLGLDYIDNEFAEWLLSFSNPLAQMYNFFIDSICDLTDNFDDMIDWAKGVYEENVYG